MRVRRLRIRGLDVVSDRELELVGGFNEVETGSVDEARALCALLDALVRPVPRISALGFWARAREARVVVTLALRNEVLLLLADRAGDRLQLARYDPARGHFEPATSQLAQLSARLREAGLPDALEAGLSSWGVGRPPDEAQARARRRRVLEARAAQLRAGLAQQRAREQELRNAEVDLEGLGERVQIARSLESRVGDFDDALAAREADRAQIEHERRELLEQRRKLREARGQEQIPTAMGLTLAGFSAGAGAVFHPLAWAGAAVGLGLVVWAQWRALRARRLSGRTDAVLAGLRVRDRSVERRFETATGGLREALAAHGLRHADELKQAKAAQRQAAERADGLRRAAEAAAREIPPDTEQQLESLEAQLAAGSAADLPDAPPAGAVRPVELAPEEIVHATARALSADESHARAVIAGALPVYLGILTDGACTHAHYRPQSGWSLRGGRPSTPLVELPGALLPAVRLAFQLAALERLAPEHGLPLLVGPDPLPIGDGRHAAVERALRRLSGATQVIRVGPADPARPRSAEQRSAGLNA